LLLASGLHSSKSGQQLNRANRKWAGLIIFVDLPSTVVPVGRDKDGLPVGVQIVGPAWQDLTTIEVGKMMERCGSAYVPPPMALDGGASL